MPLPRLTAIPERAGRTAAVTITGMRVYRGYKRTQRRAAALPPDQRDALWQRQHTESAELIVGTARRLRGLFVKAAQYLGARSDLLPEPYIAALSRLHDRVPPRRYADMRLVLRDALGAEPERVFAAFERRPVAAASLAQVHRARLRDGRAVAVKVQYPDIERLVELDMRNFSLLLRLVHRLERSIDLEPIARAVARLVPRELDFVHEGHNAERIAAALGHRDDFAVPPVVWEWSSRRVLVTEYVEGVKINDVAGLQRLGLDPRRIGAAVVDLWGEQVLRLGHFHGDPHPGNILVRPDGRIVLLDFGLAARLPDETRAAVARLCRAAAARDPVAVFAAFRGLGFIAHEDGPGSYLGLAGRVMAPARDEETANTRLARALRGFDIERVPPEVFLMLRVLGLLAGLNRSLGGAGPVLPAWLPYAAAPAAAYESRVRDCRRDAGAARQGGG
jgi:predicted unusual protein kinase regulating ubiquinone biosynthesis (AarF/ABC1/UbiB family)